MSYSPSLVTLSKFLKVVCFINLSRHFFLLLNFPLLITIDRLLISELLWLILFVENLNYFLQDNCFVCYCILLYVLFFSYGCVNVKHLVVLYCERCYISKAYRTLPKCQFSSLPMMFFFSEQDVENEKLFSVKLPATINKIK